jgi:hypothetical protein
MSNLDLITCKLRLILCHMRRANDAARIYDEANFYQQKGE